MNDNNRQLNIWQFFINGDYKLKERDRNIEIERKRNGKIKKWKSENKGRETENTVPDCYF